MGSTTPADAGAHWEKKLGYPGCHGFGKLIHTGGKYYLPCWGGVAQSPNGIDWEVDPGLAPRDLARARREHALRLVRDRQLGQSVLVRAALEHQVLEHGRHWPQVPDGAFHLAYDSNHHVLYAADFGGGVWRAVTP